MDTSVTKVSKLNTVLFVFVAVLILSFHFYFIYFVNSTYMTAFVGEKGVSLVYGIGAALNISLFVLIPKILNKWGVIKMTTVFTFIEVTSLILLAFPLHPTVAIIAFLLHMLVASALIYCMDIILGHFTNPNESGTMRGMFLTVWNIPPILTPFMAGVILGDANINAVANMGGSIVNNLHILGFWKIYAISAIFLVPFLVILRSSFNNFKDIKYSTMNVRDTLKAFYCDRNIFDVFADRLLLNLYFAWNVVYLPIFLYDHIGFSWSEIGIILSVMLLPYVLFQRIIGKIQDRKHQERQLLISGFVIISLGTIIQAFLSVPNLLAWCLLLFMTHLGSALVEVSSESYFFRHVKPENSNFISVFRMTRTLPYIIMPPIVGLCLILLPFNYMFVVLGLITLIGVRYAFLLRD